MVVVVWRLFVFLVWKTKVFYYTTYKIYNSVIDTVIVAANTDINKYEFGEVGLFFVIFDEDFMIKLYDPWPPVTSSHAWSTDFSKWCPLVSGVDNMNWDDSGTRNHIIHDA